VWKKRSGLFSSFPPQRHAPTQAPADTLPSAPPTALPATGRRGCIGTGCQIPLIFFMQLCGQIDDMNAGERAAASLPQPACDLRTPSPTTSSSPTPRWRAREDGEGYPADAPRQGRGGFGASYHGSTCTRVEASWPGATGGRHPATRRIPPVSG
jgi:hypothetical protein